MAKGFSYYTLAIAAFLTAALFTSYSGGFQDVASKSADGRGIPQIIKPVDLNRNFHFAGEKLPMDNFDVRERMDRELLVNTYWHSSTLLSIKSSAKYFPVIEKILAEHGIPDDFKYLAVAESGLRNETSPAGAKGFWQFMKGSAEEHGLEVNSEVDERYHLEKSTVAACKLLLQYKKRFGTWTLAAAAYNVGVGNLGRLLDEQRAETFYDLNLNAETSRYIFRLVAIKEIMSRPHDFGFYIDQSDYYQPLPDSKTIDVSSSIANWGDFAREHGTTYRMLKIYNPWLIDDQLTNKSGRTYEIKVPK
ncbi:MAG TPA: transglycosylase SLT domain-containing protein [Saprospiraceae bacterium]|nr:transglycosylase SLT domain-containing protein [Saprospiraceae bacterium]HMQ83102.1 transglycosylase SLT domain-containing protein [Saprospiraceae bacterium]